MLDSLISSKTKLKLLVKFFLNAENQDYLRGLESEFGESSNAIRVELNKLEEIGLLAAHYKGNRKLFSANVHHPFFKEINSMVRKYVGLDKVVEAIVDKIGNIEAIYLTGKWAQGVDSTLMDFMFIGNIDVEYMHSLLMKVQEVIGKKIRYVICNSSTDQAIIAELLHDKAYLIYGDGIDEMKDVDE